MTAAEEGRTSYSALTKHRSCPQAWTYRYLRGLVPYDEDTIDADLGSWWHLLRALDSIVRGIEAGTLWYAPERMRVGDLKLTCRIEEGQHRYRLNIPGMTVSGPEDVPELMAEHWWPTLNDDLKDRWIARCDGDPWALIMAMNARWRSRWAGHTEKELPIGVEVPWTRTLPGTDNQGTLRGTVDEIYRDESRGGLIVARDHKTHKTMQVDAEEDLMDSQLHLYAWGVSPQVREWIGKPIAATAYDRVRSNPPKQPKVTQSGGLSKSVTDYDLHTYREWAAGPDGNGQPYPGRKKDGSEAGLYTAELEVVAKLSRPTSLEQWTQRTLTPISRNIVTSHVRASSQTWRDSEQTIERYDATGEAPRNFTRYGCRWCDFSSLCRAEMIGGPDGDYSLAEMGLRTL